jgi:ribose transport system permease protein
MTAPARRADSAAGLAVRLVSVWGLLVLLIVLIIGFSILKPDTFPTAFNFRSIVSNKSIQALLALAVFIPMVANHFDLSSGFMLGISQVLAIGLQSQDQQGLPWGIACLLVLALGVVVGLVNGLLVTRVRMDSFIATLGTGTMLYGLNAWYTGGQQVLASLPHSFTAISGTIKLGGFGLPAPAIYVFIVSMALWLVFEYLPLGRHLYVLGANPRAAELNGISARRYVTLAFVASSTIAAFAGIVLQSQLQVGQSSVGQEYLLPAFTAALLGATSIRPGRVNVWGTILAVAVLAVTVAGLNQLGAPFFVEPLFNGAMLILAVGLAVTASRRRIMTGSKADAALTRAAAPETAAPGAERITGGED